MVKSTTRSSIHGTTEVELQSSLQYLNQQYHDLSVTEEEHGNDEEEDDNDDLHNNNNKLICTAEQQQQHSVMNDYNDDAIASAAQDTISKEPNSTSQTTNESKVVDGTIENNAIDNNAVLVQENVVEKGYDEVDCPICCCTMTIADVRYPLHCPTVSCTFNYCSNCIERFLIAASDGYSMASDGSNQVRITIKCPSCRARYMIPTISSMNDETTYLLQSRTTTTTNTNNTNNNNSPRNNRLNNYENTNNPTGNNNTIPSDIVLVQSVLTLRTAVMMEHLLVTKTKDSNISASELSKRQRFLDEISIEEVEDAFTKVQFYQSSLLLPNSTTSTSATMTTTTTTTTTNSPTPKDDGTQDCAGKNSSNRNKLLWTNDDPNSLRVPPLNWELFRKYLKTSSTMISNHGIGTSTSSSENQSSSNHEYRREPMATSRFVRTQHQQQQQHVAWKDPTLFLGLEELMTVAEHEFLTSMMTSGQAELIAQASTILSSVMDMSSSRRAAAAVQQIANTVSTAATPTTATATAAVGQQQGRSNTTTNIPTTTNQASKPVRLSTKCVEQIYRAKKRYPLPLHMPRCVSIPVYDPIHITTKDNSLQFGSSNNNTTTAGAQQHPKSYTLTLQSINGIAGRIGLRKGDIVTHVDGNEVHTYEEFAIHMQQCLLLKDTTSTSSTTLQQTTVQIIVNATPEIATALQQRAKTMQADGIKFPY